MIKPSYKLEVFEGPLDLLLALLKKNKIDIYDIPISLILDQYLEYLAQAEALSLEISGEFIDMASQLIYIKSKMLLPKEQLDEDDPRAGLVNALLLYQQIKGASQMLASQYATYGNRFTKPRDEIKPDKTQTDSIEVYLLIEAFNAMLLRSKRRLPPDIENFSGIVGTKIVSVSQKVITVLRKVIKQKTVRFIDAFENIESRNEMVATFLAILELTKTNRITVSGNGENCIISLTVNAEETEKNNG